MIRKQNWLKPYARGLQQKLSKFGMINALKEMLKEGGIKNEIKILTKGGLGFMRKDILELFEAFLDTEMIKLNIIRPKIIFLHPVLVDLGLALNMKNIFERFHDHLNDKYHIKAGLCTKNKEENPGNEVAPDCFANEREEAIPHG